MKRSREVGSFGKFASPLFATAALTPFAAASIAWGAPIPSAIQVAHVQVANLVLDKKYEAMHGPETTVFVPIGNRPNTSRFLWILGGRIEVRNGQKDGMRYVCHARFLTAPRDAQLGPRRKAMRTDPSAGYRGLLGLSQGHYETRFPDGFGMLVPFPADRRAVVFSVQLQSSLGPVGRTPLDVRGSLIYADGPAGKALGLKELFTAKLEVPFGPLKSLPKPVGANVDETHTFMVPPGRHRFQAVIKPVLRAAKAQVHYLQAHLHPFGKSFAITDTRTGELVWKGEAKTDAARGTLVHVDHYSSATGFTLHADREYRLDIEYENTTNAEIDAMAVATVYYR